MAEAEGSRTIHILMLEDSPLDVELSIARLRKANLSPEVTLACNRREFEEAVDRACETRCFDLVLADYALPDFDGIAALALVREKLPTLPFIFISGRVGEEVAIDTLQRGATDYVLKHRLERLVPAVLRALRESEEHRTRVRAEANLLESELRFRQVIEAVPEMIWVANDDGTLTYSNRTWRELVTDHPRQWCQPDHFHPDDYPALAAAWQSAQENRQPFSIEVRFFHRPDGSYRWHLLRVSPLHGSPADTAEQQETSWLGAATDVQDQKRNEEALRTAEKLSVTGRMAAAIAHEINNPLESLTNLLFLARLETEGNERANAYLAMTETELDRISTITKQTLQFYRDPVQPVAIDARQILEEVLKLFATRTLGKHIETTLHVESGLSFQAIKGEIRQILINLVTNAIDVVPNRGRIDVEACSCTLDGTPAIEMLVHDNGSGIAPEQADKLFTPFFSTKGVQGTGLGLWVSRGIAEKHGGTLTLAATGIDGSSRTTARLVLPLQAHPQLQAPEPAPKAAAR